MKKLLLSLAVLSAVAVTAQVGINTDEPKATLQVKAKNTNGNTPEGILTPQVTGEALTAMLANLGAEQNGMLVYVTSPAFTITEENYEQLPDPTIANVTAPGYYRFNFDGTTGEKSFVKLEPSGLQKTLEHYDETGSEIRYTSYGLVGAKQRRIVDSGHVNINAGGIDMTFPATEILGDNVGVSGLWSVGIGPDVKLTGDKSVAIGHGAEVSEYSSGAYHGLTAIGAHSKAYGEHATAIGSAAEATADNSIAIDGKAKAGNSIAIGGTTNFNASHSIAIGKNANVNTYNSIVIGENANANANAYHSIIIGKDANANAYNSIVIGEDANANAYNSIVIGNNTNTNANEHGSIVIGNNSSSEIAGGIAIGSRATATESFPISITTESFIGPALRMSEEGDLHVDRRSYSETTTGIVLNSPNGKKWRIAVGDSGELLVKEHVDSESNTP